MVRFIMSALMVSLLASVSFATKEDEDNKKVADIHTAADNAAAWRDENYIGYFISSIKDAEIKDLYEFEFTDPDSGDVVKVRCSALKENKCHEVK